MEEHMTIGQLARKSNTDRQTIRYYERIGLLPEPERTKSNYRVYDEETVGTLRFIRRAKVIGFSLSDIKVLLAMANRQTAQCDDIREFARTRLAKIQRQIHELRDMERALAELIEKCRTTNRVDGCPILESLVRGNDEPSNRRTRTV